MFADYDDIRTSPKQEFGTVQPGDIKYKDVNGDGVVNDNDKVAIGATTTPNLVYGIGASFAWKGIDVNVHSKEPVNPLSLFMVNVYMHSAKVTGEISLKI